MKPKLDALYETLGHCVVHRNGNKKYDLLLDILCSGKQKTIEEKFRFDPVIYDDIFVEILQDFITCDAGWYYHCEADYLNYVMCPDEVPKLLYCFDWRPFKPFVITWMEAHKRKLSTQTSVKGYGLTFGLTIPFRDIPQYLYTKTIIMPQMFEVFDDVPF